MDSQQSSAQPENVRERCSISLGSGWEPQPFRKIGQGSFGAIFAHPIVPVIYKREINSDSGWGWSIAGEYAMHKLISAAFDRWSLAENGADPDFHVQIPFPYGLILADCTNWWAQSSSRFPREEPAFRDPSATLQAERILSLPKAVCHDLIDKFCPSDSFRISMKTDPSNDICLLRLYLGRRTRPRKLNSDFQIHNFPCHVDQMGTLGLDAHYIAAQLGRALAVMHFEARVDGRDVEFVLGSARKISEEERERGEETSSTTDEAGQVRRRREQVKNPYKAAKIWCLDFNQCQSISFAQTSVLPTFISINQTSDTDTDTDTNTNTTSIDPGVMKCIAAYFANDPYFPRPNQAELWETFSRNYADMAEKIATASRPQQSSDSQQQDNPVAASSHAEGGSLGPDRVKSLASSFIWGIEEIFKKAQIKRCADEG